MGQKCVHRSTFRWSFIWFNSSTLGAVNDLSRWDSECELIHWNLTQRNDWLRNRTYFWKYAWKGATCYSKSSFWVPQKKLSHKIKKIKKLRMSKYRLITFFLFLGGIFLKWMFIVLPLSKCSLFKDNFLALVVHFVIKDKNWQFKSTLNHVGVK